MILLWAILILVELVNTQAIDAGLVGVSLILQENEVNIAMWKWRAILSFE